MKVTIIGTGYVGLVTGVSLALLGHNVICVGRNKDKIGKINQKEPPFYEPGLKKVLSNVVSKNLLYATDKLGESIDKAEVIIVAVGTPTKEDRIDLSEIKEVSRQIGEILKKTDAYKVVVVKSTVVPLTTEQVIKPIIEKYSGKKAGSFGLCMSPEFLREGNALEDALNPDRIVIGQADLKSGVEFAKIYQKMKVPILFTNLATAEMIKYANNALFATLISYANEVARVCEAVKGIDVVDIWKGVHLDKRLSPETSHYIYSGAGFGGSCFPKDTKAFLAFAKDNGVNTQIIRSVINVNSTQPQRVFNLLKSTLGSLRKKRIAVLGLSFKPNTDDLRESASLSIIKILLASGAQIQCHDPFISKNPHREELRDPAVAIRPTLEEALKGADAALLLTGWDEYKKITPDLLKKNMRKQILIDGRRILSKKQFIKEGVVYKGVGYAGE